MQLPSDDFIKNSLERYKKRNTVLNYLDYDAPDWARGLAYGSAKNLLGYMASGAKLLGKKEWQDKLNNAKHKIERKTSDIPYWMMAGELVSDPLNFTPAGIVSKGSKLARVAKSGVLGAGVGYASMKAKNYGDDRLTDKQKEAQNVLSGSVAGLLNMGIAGVTKGKVKGIEDGRWRMEDGVKPTDEVIASKIKADDFRLGEIGKQYKKEPDRIVGDNFVANKGVGADELRKTDKSKDTYITDSQASNSNDIIAQLYEAVKQKGNSLSLDDIKEALKLAENRSYKDVRSPNIRVANRKIVNENSGKGWESSVIKELDVKNPEYDFMLTKSDVRKINNGKVDEKILDKLYNDTVVLKQQREADNFDEIERYFYKQKYPDIDFDKKPEGMDYDTWVEANRVFANGGSNLAVGAGTGTVNAVDTAMDGGSSEDIQDSFLKGFLLGAGGSKVLSHLSPRYKKLITPNSNSNTAGMFVGAKPTDKGAFSDIATRKVMKEIDDSGVKFKRITYYSPEEEETLKKMQKRLKA